MILVMHQMPVILITTLVDEQTGTLNPNIASNSSDSVLGTEDNVSMFNIDLEGDKFTSPALN